MVVADEEALAAIENRPDTVGQMFFERVTATPDGVAYQYPDGDDWPSLTWAETGERVSRMTAGLFALGVEPEQRVAIASSTRLEWILADLAIMCARAATTTVYPTSVSEDVAHILADSSSRVIFAEDAEQLAKLVERRADLPELGKVILIDGDVPADLGDWVMSLAQLEELGAERLASDPDCVRASVEAGQPGDLACLMYTSGTTGRPKGVRLPQSAWTYEGAAVASQGILSVDDLQYLWLPLSHVFGKVLLSTQLAVGFATAVDGRVDKIIENLAVVKPTFMGAAPRIFEKAHGRVMTMSQTGSPIKKFLFNKAFAVGYECDRLEREGKPVPKKLAKRRATYDKLVFSKIRDRFGGRVRFFISGSAALNKDIAEFFNAAGIMILEGYGLTETSAGTVVNRPWNNRIGTIGLPLLGTEAKVAPDGELLLKGPGVMQGYHNLDEATSQTIIDGWLHTGDIAEIDDEGFITITDRKKDLFKTANGKYVAPSLVEGKFKAICPYVGQFVVHGDKRTFCSAIVTLDPEAIEGWAERNGMGGKSYHDIVTSDAARDMVSEHIDKLNEGLNRWEQIRKFIILDHDLSIEDGEITPSMKVKRKVVEERNRAELDSLYT